MVVVEKVKYEYYNVLLVDCWKIRHSVVFVSRLVD